MELQTNTLLSTNEPTLKVQLRDMEITPQDMYVLPPDSKHFRSGVVLRYMLMYMNGYEDSWSPCGASQGRYTHATLTSAESMRDAMLRNNSADKLALYGGAKSIFVGFVACYAGHYDPAPLNLGSTNQIPADLQNMLTIRRLAEHILRCRRDYRIE